MQFGLVQSIALDINGAAKCNVHSGKTGQEGILQNSLGVEGCFEARQCLVHTDAGKPPWSSQLLVGTLWN